MEFLAGLLTHADMFLHGFFFTFTDFYFHTCSLGARSKPRTVLIANDRRVSRYGFRGKLAFCEPGERTVFSQLHSPHPCSSLCSFPELLSPGLTVVPLDHFSLALGVPAVLPKED